MLSKREAVLLGAVALAAAYGVYSLLIAPKGAAGAAVGASPSTPANATAREITQIQQEIGRTTVSPLVRLAAARAGEEWRSSLFLWAPLPSELIERDASRQQQQQAAQTALQEAEASRKMAEERERQQMAERQRRFNYTGYVGSAGRLLAVINGVVYEVGDLLEDLPGCTLQSVTPEGIVIEDRGRATTVQVPMQQDSTQERPATGQDDEP